MAALVWPPLQPRALLAPHVPLQFMDWHGLRSAHNVQSYRLVRVAAQAFHFEIAKPCVDRVTQCGRRLRRSLKAEHALVPRLDGKPVGFLACFRRALSRRPDRSAIDGFA